MARKPSPIHKPQLRFRYASSSLFGAPCLPLCLSLYPKRAESEKVDVEAAQPPDFMRFWQRLLLLDLSSAAAV
jgi:hypothetical protein